MSSAKGARQDRAVPLRAEASGWAGAEECPKRGPDRAAVAWLGRGTRCPPAAAAESLAATVCCSCSWDSLTSPDRFLLFLEILHFSGTLGFILCSIRSALLYEYILSVH